MIKLWTFETIEKVELFSAILKENGIEYETAKKNAAINELTLSVNELDFKEAKKLLIKFKKRRTLREHIPNHK